MIMTMVPDDVLEAIIEFVRLQRILNPDAPDEEDFFLNHLPVLCAWLEGLGRLPPHKLPSRDTEAEEA
jgi:hypothetical protein